MYFKNSQPFISFGTIIVTLIMLFLGACEARSSYNQEDVLYENDFDNQEIGSKPKDLIFFEDQGEISIVKDELGPGGVLFLEDKGTKNIKIEGRLGRQTGFLTAIIDYMQPEIGNTAKLIRLMDDSSGPAAIRIETKNGGICYKNANGEYEYLAPLADGAWNRVQVNVNIAEQIARVYVNGELKLKDSAFQASAVEITRFDSYTPGSGVKSQYLDNILIVADDLPVIYESKEELAMKMQQGKDDVDVSRDDLDSNLIAPSLYEAEDALSSGTITDNKHAGYTGTGFIDFKPNAPGGTIQWNIDVKEAGDYFLVFRYAFSSGNRPLRVELNGEVVSESLDFPGTGDWANWQKTGLPVSLEAGKNTLLVTAIGAEGGANIDSLEITKEFTLQNKTFDFPVVALTDILSKSQLDLLKEKNLIVREAKAGKNKPEGNPEIIQALAFSETLIVVTIDSGFQEYNPHDVVISAATGSWISLNPALKYIPVKQAAVASDSEGNTVIVFELEKSYIAAAVEEPLIYQGNIEKDLELAKNLVSWQMDHGGWTKSMDEVYKKPWNGKDPRSTQLAIDGKELGSIDNNATTKEIRFISMIFRETGDQELKESVLKGLRFLFHMQLPSGGFPQVFPLRDKAGGSVYYSNYVTFNDNAMINVLNLFDDIINRKYPFNSDLIDRDYYYEVMESLDKAVDYILKSQIVVDGKLTAWCAQHDPVTYAPMPARSYEHASISGSESVGIVKFLMARPVQSRAIKQAVDAALGWFDQVKLEKTSYISADPNKEFFVDDPNGVAWYRFYDLKTMEPIFSGRDGVIKHRIQDIEEERQNGYSWGGSYAKTLLEVIDKFGYYPGKAYAQVVGAASTSLGGKKPLIVGQVKLVKKLK